MKTKFGQNSFAYRGPRFGTHCLMTVEKLIPSQLLKRNHDRIAPFIFHSKFCATCFLFIIELYFTLYMYLFLFKGGP